MEARGTPVRVGVVGAGKMGCNHLRVYDTVKDAELIGLFDPDEAAAASAAARFGCTRFASLDALAEAVDALSVCSPSGSHAAVGRQLLAQGKHCLIEKPLATTERDCLDLIAAAQAGGARLLVGHIERYNPAVRQVASMLELGNTVQAIDARRLSAFSRRITDIDVVGDLMVHDLDIICALVDSPVVDVYAAGSRAAGCAPGDHVTAVLRFASGALATCTASRITENTVRRLAVTTDAGFVDVDYMNQSVEVYHQDRVVRRAGALAALGEYALDISMERVQLRRGEPLQIELMHFMDVVLRDAEPITSAAQALTAMRLVWQIQEQVGMPTEGGR